MTMGQPRKLLKAPSLRWQTRSAECSNVVAHALLLGKGSKIDTRGLLFEPSLELPRDAALPELERLELPEGMLLEQMMQRVERKLIENTLRRCNYHKEQASKRLGLARSAPAHGRGAPPPARASCCATRLSTVEPIAFVHPLSSGSAHAFADA